jgi:anti-sigma factor RsiW
MTSETTPETTDREPMSCAEVEKRLEDYLAGALEPMPENRLAAHLTACPRCAAEVALGERVAFELAALPAFDAPPALIARIKDTARGTADAAAPWREAPRPRAVRAWRSRRLWPVALAAGLAMVLALGWWQSRRPAEPTVAEIATAEQEARYAFALVAKLGRRAGQEIRQEVLIERVAAPLLQGVSGRPSRPAAAKSGGMES